VAEFRGPAAAPPAPLDAAALAPLASALATAAGQVDPVPRPPFASHRARGAGLIGALKGAVALLLRPFTRLLFQRQAEFNREMLRTSELLAAQVRVLAEQGARHADQAAVWTHDVRRAREERLLVLDAVAALSAEVRAMRDRAPEAPETTARLLRLEQDLDDLSRRRAGPTRP
jgi:hypothetical protein